MEIQEINMVVCDLCNEDHTNKDEIGGMLLGSKGICPTCTKRMMPNLEKDDEANYVKDIAKEEESFRQFILRIRGNNDKVMITSFENTKDMFKTVFGI